MTFLQRKGPAGVRKLQHVMRQHTLSNLLVVVAHAQALIHYQVVEDIVRAVGTGYKVIAVRMPPPPSPERQHVASAGEPSEDAAAIPVAATAAAPGSELEQKGPGGRQVAQLVPWEVIAAGKTAAVCVGRDLAMLFP